MNNVSLMGRLTAEPELKQTPSGVSTTSFTIAIDRSYVPQGQERQADFISIVAWRQTAEFICRYFGKGKMIAVKGELRSRTYDDKRYPDVKHYVTEVYADQVYFCGGKNDDGNQSVTKGTPPIPASTDMSDFEEIASDDVPF